MKQEGYTLVEMLAVVLLIGIVCLGSMLSVKLAQKARFCAQVQEVERGIIFARDTATMTGDQYNTYCFSNRVLVRQGCEKPIYTIRLSEGTYIPDTITGKWIRFNGTMASPQTGTITLVCEDIGLKADITVRIATGKTTIKWYTIQC